MADSTGREAFVESWIGTLVEQPQRIPETKMYDAIRSIILDRINGGDIPQSLPGGIKKIVGGQVVYYWIEINDEIALGVELAITPQNLTVGIVGKNPKLEKKPPFASDLYTAILKDSPLSIRIRSDVALSDEGFKIWKRLFDQGHTVLVYDSANPGQSHSVIVNYNQMLSFFKDDATGRKYQYVLSESGTRHLDTLSFFNLRRMRELIGTL